jgi:hypothetical protein
LAGAAAAIAVLLSAATARAQVPAPPAQTAPVFEFVAPVVSPVCGNAVLVLALAPGIVSGQLGMPLPVDILPLFAPALVLCGSVPQPPAKLTCSADDTVGDAVGSAVAAAAGLPLPVETRVVGPLAEETVVIEDKLPPPLDTQGVSDRVVQTLDCRSADVQRDVGPDEEPAAEPAEQPTSIDEFDDFALPDLSLGGDLSSLDGTVDGGNTDGGAQFAAQPVVGATTGPGFAYPVVFALPLVMLVIGGYLGRVLTQPVASGVGSAHNLRRRGDGHS